MLTIITFAFGAVPQPCSAAHGHQRLGGGASSMFTVWDVSHEQEDGTEDDVCIMEATAPGRPGEFAIRKDVVQTFYKQRIWAPGFTFTYGEAEKVLTVFFAGTAAETWNGNASGTGPVFDVHTPSGPAFDQYLDELFAATSVGAIVGGRAWRMPIGGTKEAFTVLQDCISSVLTRDGRW